MSPIVVGSAGFGTPGGSRIRALVPSALLAALVIAPLAVWAALGGWGGWGSDRGDSGAIEDFDDASSQPVSGPAADTPPAGGPPTRGTIGQRSTDLAVERSRAGRAPSRDLQERLTAPRALLGAGQTMLVASVGPAVPIAGDTREPAEEPAGDPLETLLELRIDRVASRTVRAFTDGGVALLPFAALLEIAEVEHTVSSDGGVDATLHPEGRRIVVAADGVTRSDGRPVAVTKDEVFVSGDELYLAVPVLEKLLGVDIHMDWAALSATVRPPHDLPVARRLAREARWENVRNRRNQTFRGPHLELDQARVGGAVLDWSLSSSARNVEESTAYALALGGRVLDGSLRLSSRSQGPIAGGENRFDASYETVFHEVDWIRQMRLGDGFSTGPRLREVRGFALTNAPFLRESVFGTDEFVGRVQPGWEVELRQSGRTIDLTRADEEGAFALDIPLRYGENAVQVVAFGPHGQVITSDRLVLLDFDRLPGGRLEWGLSGGGCRNQRCSGSGNLDLRYGITDAVTVRAGAEGFTRDALPSVFQPYVGVTGMLNPALQLSAEAVGSGHLRGTATFAPSPWFRARAAHTAFSSALEQPVLHDAGRRNTTEADLFVRPIPRTPRLFVRASALHQSFESGTMGLYQTSVKVPVGSFSVETGVRMETRGRSAVDERWMNFQFAALEGLARVAGRSMAVRGELEYLEARQVSRVRGTVGYEVARGTRVHVGAGWERVTGARLTVSLSAYLSQLRSITQLSTGARSPAQLNQYNQGTVHWNEAVGQFDFAPGPGVERGGISGYVFVDRNGNGIRDHGEEGLAGVRVVVGSHAVTTDADGRHTSWDLIPFEPVRIWADPTSIPDPVLVPALSVVEVTVPTSSFGRVDIPVVPSREVVGRVVLTRDGVERPIPYARLELLNEVTGDVRSFRAFSDGEFYLAGIQPGRYRLRMLPEELSDRGLAPVADDVRVEVEAVADFSIVGPLVLTYRAAGEER